MAIYGMKDAANLMLIDKVTGLPVLFIDYANATSSEWTSEQVFATKKGTNAIRWDNARTGTLTVDTEMFDFGLLAMVMGSEVENGTSDVFTRVQATLDGSKQVDLGANAEIDPDTLSVIKLKRDLVEHDGMPLINTSNQIAGLPAMVTQVQVQANAIDAKIGFPAVAKAEKYIIKRNGEVIGEPTANSFIDTGLTPESKVTYTVTAMNSIGSSPESALVEVTMAASGVTEYSLFTATTKAIADAAANVGQVLEVTAGQVVYSFENGVITFNDYAIAGENYAIYYMEPTENVKTISINANKFPSNYEIFANATIREQETGQDELVQIHYKNAKPQSNFSLVQSATEPTSLSIVFDLFPDNKQDLAEIKVVQ